MPLHLPALPSGGGSLAAQEPFQVMGRHETSGQSPGPEDLSVGSKAGPEAEQHSRVLYVPLCCRYSHHLQSLHRNGDKQQ